MKMKKLLTILMIMLLSLALVACGGGGGTDTEGDGEGGGNDVVQSDGGGDEIDEIAEGFLGTRTGKFYSQFSGDEMYMEYEMEMEGETTRIISATKGDMTYSETIMGGTSLGTSLMDSEYMYTIDHASKTVFKMGLNMSTGEIVAEIIEEEDVNMDELVEGTRIIDGKTYETEEWSMEGATAVYCYDGNELAYIVSAFEGEEILMKIVKITDDVDDSLFEIPADYTVMEF